jgi:hypothetical protein
MVFPEAHWTRINAAGEIAVGRRGAGLERGVFEDT